MSALFSENNVLAATKPIIAILLIFGMFITQGQTASVAGTVLDQNSVPISNVNIVSGTLGTSTDTNGYYILQLTAETKNTITFSHLGHKNVVLENLILTTNETFEFNPVMKTDAIQVAGVDVTATGRKNIEGITTIPQRLLGKYREPMQVWKIF
ncbi:carboxypeptidase-like regulatory domain-containing protein [Flagellimonas sp. CMM7]|uniref:carboxypeptidase-like regulatory domain-containing protein n=1 Tax=Flagellimonas sp. CMM7 TaxID=2654676 RepID=UPI00351D85FE